MDASLYALLVTAISIAFIHTLTGPDHYLPFIALSKTRNWSILKTIFWVFICGMAHVGSSVALGLGGAAIGWNIQKIGWLENIRGGIAGWLMLLFGVIYSIWGWLNTKNKHKHFDIDDNGNMYVFEHRHTQAINPSEKYKITPWVMFIVFLLGPCEPMIPLLFYPAAQHSIQNMVLMVILYMFFTIFTMLSMVILGFYGIAFVQTKILEKYMHLLGGLTLLLCGIFMVFLGW